MNDFRADLHCHSTCSDGTQTPAQLIQIAKDSGLSALSITDHDTFEAYATAFPIAAEAGITLLQGIELSAHMSDKSVHILGYGFNLDNTSLTDLCTWHRQRRKDRNTAMLELLAKHGMPLQYEDLESLDPIKNTIGRPHIAFAMIKKGYVSTPQEAFNKYLGDGKPCFVRGATYAVQETINAIHEAKGVAVIAHPHLIKDSNLLHSLLNLNFDGIECYYGKMPAPDHDRWLKVAKKKNWLITGGSDFHGDAKPNINLGCSWIDQDHFQALLSRLGK